MSKIEIRDLTKSYDGKTNILEKISLDVEEGEFYVLVGPSGCGKSTLLRIIAGLEKITDGTLTIDGKVANNMPPKDRNLSMVFQNYALYPHMTVKDNILFGLDVKKVPKSEQKRRLDEAAEMLGLTQYLKRKPRELSGGQRQRVALARSVCSQSPICLMDEPLSNLDAKLRAQMRTEIAKLHKRLGTTFIYVTHDQTEAMTMGDRIVVMKDGFIQQVDTPQNLYDYPINEFVAGFMGSPQMNFIDAKLGKNGNDYTLTFGACTITVPKKKADGAIANLADYVGKDVVFGIRPEDVHDEPEFIEKVGGAHVTCDVEVTELMGAETYLYLNCEGNAVTARVEPTSTAKSGDKSKIAFDLNKMHLFDKETEKTILN